MATLRDIAEAAGVDKSTVSCVLSGKARQARISVAREAQVMDVARRMNFRVNSAARATRQGSFGCVALLTSTDGKVSTLSARTQAAIHDALSAREIHLLLTRLPDEKLTSEGHVPKILRQACADALLINYTDHIPEKMVDLLRSHHIPSIWLNTRQPFNCVHPDDRDAGYRATLNLISTGHRRIAFVNYAHGTNDLPIAHYSVADRQAGYERAMTDAGFEARVIRGSHSLGMHEVKPMTRAWLSGPNRPSAILTYGDQEAVAITFITLEMGLSIPGDLTVTTFSNDPMRVVDQVFPTWIVPQQPLGIRSVELLMQKVSRPADELVPVAVPFSLITSEEEFIAGIARQEI